MYHRRLSMIAKINQKSYFSKVENHRLKRLESQFNVRNRWVGTKMTSQIAGIDILHILVNENTYMKRCSKSVVYTISIYTNLASGLIYINIIIYLNIYLCDKYMRQEVKLVYRQITEGLILWIFEHICFKV